MLILKAGKSKWKLLFSLKCETVIPVAALIGQALPAAYMDDCQR